MEHVGRQLGRADIAWYRYARKNGVIDGVTESGFETHLKNMERGQKKGDRRFQVFKYGCPTWYRYGVGVIKGKYDGMIRKMEVV